MCVYSILRELGSHYTNRFYPFYISPSILIAYNTTQQVTLFSHPMCILQRAYLKSEFSQYGHVCPTDPPPPEMPKIFCRGSVGLKHFHNNTFVYDWNDTFAPVSYRYCNRLPQTEWSETIQTCSLPAAEVRHVQSRCLPGCAPSGGSGGDFSPCPFQLPSPVGPRPLPLSTPASGLGLSLLPPPCKELAR